MRIMHIYGHNYGGSFVVTQLIGLKNLGHKVMVICPSKGPFTAQLENNGIDYRCVDFQGSNIQALFKIFKSIKHLLCVLREFEPDIVHCHLIKAILIGRILKFFLPDNFKLVSELGGPLTLDVKKFRFLDFKTSFLDDHIICSSKYIYDTYENNRIKIGQKSILHYAFDFDRFTLDLSYEERKELKHSLEILDNDFVLLIVSHLYNVRFKEFNGAGLKGHEILFYALSKLKNSLRSVKLIVVGQDIDGSSVYLDELRGLALTLGIDQHIRFIGHSKDVCKFIAISDVAVVPSITENCGGAVEPLLMGKPVIASNVGGLPDVVIDDTTGWLFSVGDADELSKKIELAVNTDIDVLNQMGYRGKDIVHSLFEPNANARKLELIYSDLIK